MLRTAVLAPAVALALAAGTVSVDRTMSDPRISEASGLAASLRHRGVLWTHNDSGHEPLLFAVRADGRTAATVRLSGVQAYDWEAIAAYRDSSGRPMLAVADTGDNRGSRSSVQIVVLPEPALRDATVRPSRVLRLRYPTGAMDAEALLVDPDGRRAFVVTKGFGGSVYEVPPKAWTSPTTTEATLVRLAGMPLMLVTDGVMGPGGHPLLRTYSELAVLPPLTDDVRGGTLQPLAEMRLPSQRQGESLTLRDSSTVLVGTEGAGAQILRVPLPPDLLEALRSERSPTPSDAPSDAPSESRPATATARPGDAPASEGASRRGLEIILVLAAGVLVAGAAIALLSWRAAWRRVGR